MKTLDSKQRQIVKGRIAIAWVLYLAGDLWCRAAVNRTLGHWFEWPYRVYNRFMVTAFRVQGDGPGPWENVNKLGGL